jgi:hypothetical protein
MATSDDISGGLPAECTSQRPNGAHRQRTIVRRTPGVLVLANDNRKRHEQDLAIEAGAVDALARANVADPAALIEHTALLQAVRAVRRHVESIVTNAAPSDRTGPVFA